MSSSVKKSNEIPISKHLGYLIKITQQEIRKRMDAGLKKLSLTTPQYAVLSQLEDSPGLSNAGLARRSFITPQTMNQIVFILEKEGLIARTNHSTNQRIQQTNLTSEGKALLKKAHKIVFQIEDTLFQDLSEEEKVSLAELLEKIRVE